MEAPSPGLLDLLVKKMSYLNKAQSVHAQNVANVNTPGYDPMSITPFSFNDAMKQAGVSVATTDPRHIVPVSLTGPGTVAKKASAKEASDAGDVEMESTKVSQTGMEYQLVTQVYHKMMGLFRIALKGS